MTEPLATTFRHAAGHGSRGIPETENGLFAVAVPLQPGIAIRLVLKIKHEHGIIAQTGRRFAPLSPGEMHIQIEKGTIHRKGIITATGVNRQRKGMDSRRRPGQQQGHQQEDAHHAKPCRHNHPLPCRTKTNGPAVTPGRLCLLQFTTRYGQCAGSGSRDHLSCGSSRKRHADQSPDDRLGHH